jgi:hypothetical protein
MVTQPTAARHGKRRGPRFISETICPLTASVPFDDVALPIKTIEIISAKAKAQT